MRPRREDSSSRSLLFLGFLYARHTQTFNLYALWTMRFGQTHGVPCPQVRSGGRLAGPRWLVSKTPARKSLATTLRKRRSVIARARMSLDPTVTLSRCRLTSSSGKLARPRYPQGEPIASDVYARAKCS